MRTAAGTFHCSIGYLFMDVARQKRDLNDTFVRVFFFICLLFDRARSRDVNCRDSERIIIRGRKKKYINERKKNKKRARAGEIDYDVDPRSSPDLRLEEIRTTCIVWFNVHY